MGKIKRMHPLQKWIDKHSSVTEVADAVGCSKAHICNIIAERKVASLGLAIKLHKFTGLSMGTFLDVQRLRELRALEHCA